jgi:NADH:ubiquinone oxidoreductase subunit 5 (subunit L)/multisubunit Na+/H+ antiporter MnhA subunit
MSCILPRNGFNEGEQIDRANFRTAGGGPVSALLLATIALPGLATIAALAAGPSRGGTAARWGVLLNGIAFAGAVAVLVAVWAGDPISAVIEGDDGLATFGFYADRLAALLLILVIGVSAIVQAFAGRYLGGDFRATRFFAGANLLTFATALMVTAATFVGLAVAWSVAGLAVILLLAMYSGFPAAREGVRRTIRCFVIGDIALWAAVVLATIEWGTLDMRQLGDQAQDLSGGGFLLAAVACLIVIGALARSAQLPLQNWLPATLAVPTPVSALLHAGVVNAGGILLVMMSPVFGASSEATHLAFIAGAATTVYGTALMLSKPDIKGALAHSTMGQMGFMIMTCGLGVYAAAIFHLFAHGMYKATLFLNSGSAIHAQIRHSKAPPAPKVPRGAALRAAAISIVVPAIAIYGAAELFFDNIDSGGWGLLLFAWATGAWACWGWQRRHPSWGGALTSAAGVAAIAFAYVLLLSAVKEFLAPALAGAGDQTVSVWWVVGFFALLLLAISVRFAAPGGRLAELRKSAYVIALGAGQVLAPRSRSGPPPGSSRKSPAGLMPSSEGAGS